MMNSEKKAKNMLNEEKLEKVAGGVKEAKENDEEKILAPNTPQDQGSHLEVPVIRDR